MTGFAQVRGEVQDTDAAAAVPAPSNGRVAFSLSLKSVNHRFLDLHFRLPSGTDSLEMQLRRLLKEKIARGHIEVSLSLERSSSEAFSLNRELVGGYIAAFRAAAALQPECPGHPARHQSRGDAPEQAGRGRAAR